MKIYTIKIALHGVSPMVWRRIKLAGTTSLADLHNIIQLSNGWDDDYLNRFHIYGKDYGVYHDGGMNFSDDAHSVYLDDFGFDGGDRFFYEYNFFEHWLVDIRVEEVNESLIPVLQPCCTKGNGMPGASKYDAFEPTMNLLQAIAKADSTTTFGDIRPFVEALNAVKFNRHYLNKQLKTGEIAHPE